MTTSSYVGSTTRSATMMKKPTLLSLIKMKTDHEGWTARVDEDFAETAARLLIDQSVTTINESGGISAHTINIYPLSKVPNGGRFPQTRFRSRSAPRIGARRLGEVRLPLPPSTSSAAVTAPVVHILWRVWGPGRVFRILI